MTDLPLLLTIAVLGGTGKEGKGLAYRWARAGYHVLIGSRDESKAGCCERSDGVIGGRSVRGWDVQS